MLVVDARDFPPEEDDCDARYMVAARNLGWRRFMAYGYRGQRFTGCGMGADTQDVRIDVYGSSGDYLASALTAWKFGCMARLRTTWARL